MSDDVTVQIALEHKPDEVLVLRPGDRLVLRYDGRLTAAQADEIRLRLKESNVHAALIVADGFEVRIDHD